MLVILCYLQCQHFEYKSCNRLLAVLKLSFKSSRYRYCPQRFLPSNDSFMHLLERINSSRRLSQIECFLTIHGKQLFYLKKCQNDQKASKHNDIKKFILKIKNVLPDTIFFPVVSTKSNREKSHRITSTLRVYARWYPLIIQLSMDLFPVKNLGMH